MAGRPRVAFCVGLNVEHFTIDRPSTSLNEATATLVPDPLNYGWCDYGPRVGIWRVMDVLDRHGIRASVLLNSDVCERYPQIVEAGNARGWAWLAHGKNNSTLQTDVDDERAYLTDVIETIQKATGRRPRGWLGPAAHRDVPDAVPARRAGPGLRVGLDQRRPALPLNVPGMLSVPYSLELNDLAVFTMHGRSGDDFAQMVTDQFDQLHAESAESGRVMALALHPFVIGQAFRAKYLDQALKYIAEHPGVWLTTSDEIAAHYANATASA